MRCVAASRAAMETQKCGMPCARFIVPSIGSTIHSTSAFGIAGIIRVAFLADAAGLGKMVEQDVVDQVLAFHVGGQLDVVGEGSR